MDQDGVEVDDLAQRAAIGDFVELWTADREQGQQRSLGEYLRRFPAFESAIAREYLALVDTRAEPSTAFPRNEAPEMFGPYRKIRLLGQGGQGEVWLAEDTRLQRQVALKVLSAAVATAPLARVERLRREAKVLARLAHPGICTIYEAELDGPRPYLAMQFVAGETLATLLTQRARAVPGTPLAPPSNRAEIAPWLQFFRAAGLALHAAHELGIVHRDVKPGNLMRTPDGMPVLLDFGFALDVGAAAPALTQSGDLFGTLPYMAPETLLGHTADHRVDVHALAVTMYETLTGERPFVGVTHAAMRRAIETGDARRLDEVLPGCGADLALVVNTAMERDPARRYATAAAFAEDLRRVHAGEPIAATPISRWIHLQRAVSRHPVLATGIGLLAAGLLVALVLLAQLARERSRLQALRQAHLGQQIVAEQPGMALYTVTEAALAEHHPEINDVLYQALDACLEERTMIFPQDAAALDSPWIAVTRDDRHLVRGFDKGEIQVVDLGTGQVAGTIRHGEPGWTTVALATADALLSGGRDGAVRCFDLVTGECRRTWNLHQPALAREVAIAHIAVTHDGQRGASCGSDGLVAVFALDGGEPVLCRGHVGGVSLAAFDPSGTRLATVGGKFVNLRRGDHTVRIFDAASGRLLHTFGPCRKAGQEEPRFVHWVDWSHDGTRIAIAYEDGVECRDAGTGAVVATLPNRSPVNWVAFAPGDEQIVLGSAAGLAVHDARTGGRIAGHSDFQGRSVFRGEFSPDGTRLAVIAWDDTARIYDVRTWQLQRTFRGVITRSRGLCWNHAGTRLYTMGGALQSWYAGERPFLPVLRAGGGPLVSVEFSPDGNRVLAASGDGDVRVWDTAKRVVQTTLHAGVPLRGARYSRSGEHILLLPEAAPALLADERTILRPLGTTPAVDGWFLLDGRIVLAGADGAVRLHEPRTGLALHTVRCHQGPVVCAELDARRLLLATGGEDRRFCVVSLADGRKLYDSPAWRSGTTGERESVFGLAFAPDGQHLYVACEDLKIRKIDLVDGFASLELILKPTPGRLLAGPDGALLFFAAQWSGNVFRCRASDLGSPDSAAPHHSNMLVALRRQPGGVLALTASKDGTVAVFDACRDQLISVIHAARCSLVDACFSPDGSLIATADEAGDVRIWPVDPLALALRVRPDRARWSLRAR